jgi:hypothetical protein
VTSANVQYDGKKKKIANLLTTSKRIFFASRLPEVGDYPLLCHLLAKVGKVTVGFS